MLFYYTQSMMLMENYFFQKWHSTQKGSGDSRKQFLSHSEWSVRFVEPEQCSVESRVFYLDTGEFRGVVSVPEWLDSGRWQSDEPAK
jgi:hypothetical protein